MPVQLSADSEVVRAAVRARYGSIARERPGNSTACCDGDDVLSCCSNGRSSNADSPNLLGYSAEEITAVPEGANLGLGCGTRLAAAELKSGETVLDLGSGAGF